MNTLDYFNTLFDSLYWGRDQVLDAAAGMTEAEFSAPNGFEYGSIRGILTHTLGAEVNYLHRCVGTTPPAPDSAEAITEANLRTVEALKASWQTYEQAMRSYLASLSEGDLEALVSFRRRDGEQVAMPLWHILTQVYQHGLQHRSEAAEALTMIGRSPGGLDFHVYLASK